MSDTEAFLAQPCPTCGTPIGDHSVRTWTEHSKVDHPWENTPRTPMAGMPADARMCDLVDVRALLASASALGPLGAVEFHFQIGRIVGGNETVGRPVFVGSPEVLRKAGQLMRSACNRAADAGEGKVRTEGPL